MSNQKMTKGIMTEIYFETILPSGVPGKYWNSFNAFLFTWPVFLYFTSFLFQYNHPVYNRLGTHLVSQKNAQQERKT